MEREGGGGSKRGLDAFKKFITICCVSEKKRADR